MEEGGIEIDDDILAAATGENLEQQDIVAQQEESNSVVNLDQDFEDAVKDMTYGRRLARHLSKYAWYNPHVNDEKQSINTACKWSGRSVGGNSTIFGQCMDVL